MKILINNAFLFIILLFIDLSICGKHTKFATYKRFRRNSGDIRCKYGEVQCLSGKCIKYNSLCDGSNDCLDNSDEMHCPLRYLYLLNPVFARVERWILQQRKGREWGEKVAKATTALYLSNAINRPTVNSSLDRELMMKELELSIVADLIGNTTIPTEKIVWYINALLATCNDPYNFYGYDLVSALNEMMSKTNYVDFSGYLTLCLAGYNISDENLQKLISSNFLIDSYYAIDSIALKTLAMKCIYERNKDKKLKIKVNNSINVIKTFQQPDGSFGNLYTTAFILQALVANDNYEGWDFIKAVKYIFMRYNSSLSNSSVEKQAAYFILPTLVHKTYISLLSNKCSRIVTRKSDEIIIYDKDNKNGKNLIHYSVWIGEEASTKYSIHLLVPDNNTLLQIMEAAQEYDSNFRFHSGRINDDIYVYSISGTINILESRDYWLLYKENNSKKKERVLQGINKLYATEGDHFIFWYRKITD